MNRIYELQKKIETARHELDEALLQENRFEYYYEKSTRLDKLIEEYLGAEDFTDLSPELMKKYKQRFWNIELFIPTPNGLMPIAIRD